MKQARREAPDGVTLPPSHVRYYLALGMTGSLIATLIGLIYEQRSVWDVSLVCFGLICAQVVLGYYCSRERPVVAVQITVTDRPLSRTTL
jgi:hypothetical protein